MSGTCSRCGRDANDVALISRPSGLVIWCSWCVLAHKRNLITKRKAWQKQAKSDSNKSYYVALRRDPCAYCGAPMRELDHIDPLWLGLSGSDLYWQNLTPSCEDCNRDKADDTLLVFLLRRAKLHDDEQDGVI